MNNCTVCGKDVGEHEEGRETDRCVAEKLGLVEGISDFRLRRVLASKWSDFKGHYWEAASVPSVNTCLPHPAKFYGLAYTATLAIIRAFLCVTESEEE